MEMKIQLFGSMKMVTADTLPLPLTGRSALLLAYLLLHHDRTIARAELLEHVWADRGDRLTAGAFNTALWRLRRLLDGRTRSAGALLRCDTGGGIGLDPAALPHVDVLVFDRLVQPALAVPCAALTPALCRALLEGVALYPADLLLDHGDDWVLRERERYRRQYLNARGRLMEHAMLHHDPVAAIGHAQAVLDCEPLREDVHRVLMTAYVAAGQRALALRQFERCRTLLRQELAIAPMPDTVALYRQIAESALASGSLSAACAADSVSADMPRLPVALHPEAPREDVARSVLPLPLPRLSGTLSDPHPAVSITGVLQNSLLDARRLLQMADQQIEASLMCLHD